jgi:hypothetical protein
MDPGTGDCLGAQDWPSAAAVAEQIIQSRRYPEQGYRACLGLIRLARRYPVERVEAACARALTVKACSYQSVKSILETGLDHQSIEDAGTSEAHRLIHTNVRGAAYYAEEVSHDA